MIVVMVLIYLLVGLVAGLFLYFPDLRTSVFRLSRLGVSAVDLGGRRGMARIARDGGRVAGKSLAWLGSAGIWLRRRRALVAVAAVVAATPALLALALRPHYALDAYADTVATRDPVVASLLNGEQLVAPPPLPPELFVSREVESVRPALGNASRNWDLVDREFRQRLLVVFRIMRAQGYDLALLEGYRSPERQDY